MKKCNRCCKWKKIDDFYKQLHHKTSWCRLCILEVRREQYHSNKIKYQQLAAKYRMKNPTAKRNTKLKQAYGFGIEGYEKLLKSQGGVCAGCKLNVILKRKNGKSVAMGVDHCHVTGKARGILCHNCNLGISYAKEDITILKSWIHYIRKYQK